MSITARPVQIVLKFYFKMQSIGNPGALSLSGTVRPDRNIHRSGSSVGDASSDEEDRVDMKKLHEGLAEVVPKLNESASIPVKSRITIPAPVEEPSVPKEDKPSGKGKDKEKNPFFADKVEPAPPGPSTGEKPATLVAATKNALSNLFGTNITPTPSRRTSQVVPVGTVTLPGDLGAGEKLDWFDGTIAPGASREPDVSTRGTAGYGAEPEMTDDESVRNMSEEIGEVQQDINDLHHKLGNVEVDVTLLKKSLGQLGPEKITEILKELSDHKAAIIKFDNSVNTLVTRLETITDQLMVARTTIAELKTENTALKDAMNAVRQATPQTPSFASTSRLGGSTVSVSSSKKAPAGSIGRVHRDEYM
jgi:predicted  nucleic acid-binding Zn-ribbon protein